MFDICREQVDVNTDAFQNSDDVFDMSSGSSSFEDVEEDCEVVRSISAWIWYFLDAQLLRQHPGNCVESRKCFPKWCKLGFFVRINTDLRHSATLRLPTPHRLRPYSTCHKRGPLWGLQQYQCCSSRAVSSAQTAVLGSSSIISVAKEMRDELKLTKLKRLFSSEYRKEKIRASSFSFLSQLTKTSKENIKTTE